MFTYPTFPIIKDIWETKLFASRRPVEGKLTESYKRVEKYLIDLYNGTFIANLSLPLKEKKRFDNSYLNCLAGDWDKIKEAILSSLPIEAATHVYQDMHRFFWNEHTNHSIFLYRFPIKSFSTMPVNKWDLAYLKEKELPFDFSRCSEVMCPKYDKCRRPLVGQAKIYSYTSFIFDENGCDHFIKL
jgi:hypothetical protein